MKIKESIVKVENGVVWSSSSPWPRPCSEHNILKSWELSTFGFVIGITSGLSRRGWPSTKNVLHAGELVSIGVVV